MSLKDLRAELDEEVSSIMGADFRISITNTDFVPHSSDATITFSNLDTKMQGTKLIDTCILYIDIRRSTDLNLSHKPTTVAKLYSAFIRAMTRVARYHKGHVRGIIGDRLMVIFDRKDSFVNAVSCAIAMNTVSKHIINRHFRANEVACGIGIDSGKMLATKTGVRRHGDEQGNYRNLVWLGRPANVASKLTDIANKPSESVEVDVVHVAYERRYAVDIFSLLNLGSVGAASDLGLGALSLGIAAPSNPGLGALSNPGVGVASDLGLGALSNPGNSNYSSWRWEKETPLKFLSNLEVKYVPSQIIHKDPMFESFFLSGETKEIRPRTPPILMTGRVWAGFRSAKPDDNSVKQSLFKRINVTTPGYSGEVYGGDVIFRGLKE